MGKKGSPSYSDREGYLIEHKNTGIKNKWNDLLGKVEKVGVSRKRGEVSMATAQEVFRTIRDLFVNNSSDVDNYYKVEAFKASVRLPSKRIDECLKPIIKAISDLKEEISSRPVERKCIRTKGGHIVWGYGMTPVNNNDRKGKEKKGGK